MADHGTKEHKAAAEKARKEAAYAWHAKAVARRSGKSPKTKPAPPTAAQIRSKKAETRRKKYTPSGLQSLVDVMTKKKPTGK